LRTRAEAACRLRAVPLVAALGAPLVWQVGRPDLFDSFSLGMIFVQMMVPDLRNKTMQTNMANDLRKYNNSWEFWRQSSTQAQRCDFSLLDRQGGVGNNLAKRLICERNGANRGRLTAAGILLHPFFFLPDL
jgi:hypothetical protein